MKLKTKQRIDNIIARGQIVKLKSVCGMFNKIYYPLYDRQICFSLSTAGNQGYL